MSVPSSKTIVTWERPYFEIERVLSSRGRPPMAFSITKLTRCSTSSGV